MEATSAKQKVVIVGGGITGLAAAYYLKQQSKLQQVSLDIVLIESSLRLGGKIQTERSDGFIIERGPESFLDTNEIVRKLARALNIEHLMQKNERGHSYIALKNGVSKIPEKLLFGEEIKPSTMLTSNLLTISGKLRAAGDLILPRGESLEDESITDFFSRRFGNEFMENIVEPLLAATFAGDIDHLSMQSMFPRFYALEQKHRSLILGMQKANVYPLMKNHSLCYETFDNGLQTLVETLENKLSDIQILKGVKVIGVDKHEQGLAIHFNNIASIHADAAIITTPFHVAQNIFKKQQLLERVPGMKSATIATVNIAFKSEDVPKLKDAINFFVSRNSGYSITSCTWSNRKWQTAAPKGYDLLRLYIGRVGDEAIVELSDSEIERIVLKDLRKILGVTVRPHFVYVTRWKQAMPQYTVGHEERLSLLRKHLHETMPNVCLAGSSYEGISIPRCIEQGKKVSENLVKQFVNQSFSY